MTVVLMRLTWTRRMLPRNFRAAEINKKEAPAGASFFVGASDRQGM